MLSTPLPFFCRKSLGFSDTRFFNSIAIIINYFDLLKLKKEKENSPECQNEFCKTSWSPSFGKAENWICPKCNTENNKVFLKSPIPETLCLNESCKSFYSDSFPRKDLNSIWICPFCNTENKLFLNPQIKIPADLQYFKDKPNTNFEWEKKLLFVICIDYSGSMTVNYFRLSEKTEILKFGENIPLKYIEEIKLITRKKLICDTLEKIFNKLLDKKYEMFDIRVFMIFFNDKVHLLGDCQTEVKPISKIDLENELFGEGMKYAEDRTSKFDINTKNRIVKKLEDFKEEGKTALGPAIAVALGVVEKLIKTLGIRNSFIFVLTDGLSNTGAGNLDFSDGLSNTEAGKRDIKKELERKNALLRRSLEDYDNMNKNALKLYPRIYFISFEDEISNLHYFKNHLLKRTNGNLYQIKVYDKLHKDYKFYDDKHLESYMIKTIEDIFQGKLCQAFIYQIPGCELKLFKRNDVHIEKVKLANDNEIIKIKTCYSEGESYKALFLDYSNENFEKNESIFFQTKVEFFSLDNEKIETFISNRKMNFFVRDKKSPDYKKIVNKKLIESLLMNEEKNTMKNEKLLTRYEEFLFNFNDIIEKEKEKEKESKGKINQTPTPTPLQKYEEPKSDQKSEEEEDLDDHKTTHIFYEEKTKLQNFNNSSNHMEEVKNEDSQLEDDMSENDNHHTTQKTYN